VSENYNALYFQHRTGQDAYTYFLLAAAASALAFAIQKTDTLSYEWSMVPLGLAAVSWGFSFYFGCKNITWVQTALSANIALLQLKSGSHPNQPDQPGLLGAAVSGVSTAIKHNADKAYFYATWQFRTLIAGGVLFIAWHIIKMYVRTIAA
jgi:hypothetical protein